MIELAVRMRNENIDEPTFLAAKTKAVQALVSSWGIGPEREFEPFLNKPEQADKVYIGMTKYSGYWAMFFSMFNIRLLLNLPKFIRMQNIITGVFLKSEDKDFDYVNFGRGDNITKFAVIRPNGITEKELRQERAKYLMSLANEQGVVGVHSFKSLWGLKNANVLVHCVIYQDREAYDECKKREVELSYVADFTKKTTPLIISSCTNVK